MRRAPPTARASEPLSQVRRGAARVKAQACPLGWGGPGSLAAILASPRIGAQRTPPPFSPPRGSVAPSSSTKRATGTEVPGHRPEGSSSGRADAPRAPGRDLACFLASTRRGGAARLQLAARGASGTQATRPRAARAEPEPTLPAGSRSGLGLPAQRRGGAATPRGAAEGRRERSAGERRAGRASRGRCSANLRALTRGAAPRRSDISWPGAGSLELRRAGAALRVGPLHLPDRGFAPRAPSRSPSRPSLSSPAFQPQPDNAK